MRLHDFPKFRAEHAEVQGQQVVVYGRFDQVAHVRECRSWLWLGNTAAWGDLEVLDSAARTAEFHCWKEDFDEARFFLSLPWVPGSVNPPDLFQVLDETAVWEERMFRPSDALASPTEDGWRQLTRIGSRKGLVLGEHDYIVEGGWNHEHCFICDEYIDEEQPHCFRSTSEGRDWLACPSCFNRWILHHDAGFALGD